MNLFGDWNRESLKKIVASWRVILGVLLIVVAVTVYAVWSRRARLERQAKARYLMDSALLIATACDSASPAELQTMQQQLEKDEALISKGMGWDDGSPWWDLSGKVGAERLQAKRAFHNRLVRWGCFKK